MYRGTIPITMAQIDGFVKAAKYFEVDLSGLVTPSDQDPENRPGGSTAGLNTRYTHYLGNVFYLDLVTFTNMSNVYCMDQYFL